MSQDISVSDITDPSQCMDNCALSVSVLDNNRATGEVIQIVDDNVVPSQIHCQDQSLSQIHDKTPSPSQIINDNPAASQQLHEPSCDTQSVHECSSVGHLSILDQIGIIDASSLKN